MPDNTERGALYKTDLTTPGGLSLIMGAALGATAGTGFSHCILGTTLPLMRRGLSGARIPSGPRHDTSPQEKQSLFGLV